MAIAQVADRLDGLRDGAADATVTVITTSGLGVADGREAVDILTGMPARNRPTAMFCANDMIALGALQQATTTGVRVPEELAIVGYDDIDFAAAAAVPLSSVAQPREQLGQAAAALLLQEAEGLAGHHHRQVVFRPSLVVRASSDHPRAAAPAIA